MSLTLLSSRSHGKIPKQLLIATLAGLYNTSPEDILRQLRAFDIPQIAPYATDAVDVNTLIYRLQYEKEASLDMLGSVWPIITEAILSRITGLPVEVISAPALLARLPQPIILEGENTWRGGELESAIAGDVNWASQKNLRLFFNLNLAQLGWLTVRGILLVQHLEGGAMPGWPLWMLEETRVLKKIDLLRNNGAIEELADGKLLTLHEIEILHRISPKAMIDLMLKDKIMCPLWDFEGNCGWPIGYVQWVSKNVGDST